MQLNESFHLTTSTSIWTLLQIFRASLPILILSCKLWEIYSTKSQKVTEIRESIKQNNESTVYLSTRVCGCRKLEFSTQRSPVTNLRAR